jgi:hypothetical protein
MLSRCLNIEVSTLFCNLIFGQKNCELATKKKGGEREKKEGKQKKTTKNKQENGKFLFG